MNLKFLLKGISFLIFISNVFADYTGDCKDMIQYLNEEDQSYYRSFIYNCEVNSEGKVVELVLKNNNLSEETIKNILSYDTITSLIYIVDIGHVDSGLTQQYPVFPDIITKLPNLEELELTNNEYFESHTYARYYQRPIDENVLKLPNSLKKLTLKFIELSQTNIDEISTITNLKELNLSNCKTEGLNFEPINSLKQLNTLSLTGYSDLHEDPHYVDKGLLKSFKSIKELDLTGMTLNQDNINEIAGLKNLENLKLLANSSLDLTNLKKLKKISSVFIKYFDRAMFDIDERFNIDRTINFKFNKNIKQLTIDDFELGQKNIDEIASYTNLNLLNFKSVKYSKDVKLDKLKNLKNLLALYMEDSSYNSEFPSFIKSLSKLKELKLVLQDIETIPDDLNLKNLELLELNFNEIKAIPETINNLVNLKTINLNDNKIVNIPESLGDLKNLESLDLSYNKIDDTIPKSLNNLTKLEYISLDNNVNIKGETLTNESLKACYYNKYPDLCIAKDMECIDKNLKSALKTCSTSNYTPTTTITTTTTIISTITTVSTTTTTSIVALPTSVNGKCGEKDGQCPEGNCCSKYGWCGTSKYHCGTGCQPQYGLCIESLMETTTTTPTTTTTTSTKTTNIISTNGQCGTIYGHCPSGTCCSKYGWCGSTDSHCGIGCQSDFGKCN